MPDRPPNCRTAEIACAISEMHALSPNLAGKRCTNEEISFFVKAYILTNSMDETTAKVIDTALATF